MKSDLNEFPVRYTEDKSGEKTDVIISVAFFEELMEKFEKLFLVVLAEQVLATETDYYQWEDVKENR